MVARKNKKWIQQRKTKIQVQKLWMQLYGKQTKIIRHSKLEDNKIFLERDGAQKDGKVNGCQPCGRRKEI